MLPALNFRIKKYLKSYENDRFRGSKQEVLADILKPDTSNLKPFLK